MRGKPASRDKQGSGRRITPAGAGKTRCLHQPAAVSTDHPRRCGENSFLIYFSKPIAGSPPQVRGKHYPSKNRFPYYRITPAGAGKTYYRRMVQLRLQDHPRRCGENDSLKKHIAEIAGSPPQVRGKLRRKKRRIATSRITPAGAGKTMILIIQKSTNAGSPPQVRGKPLLSLSTTYSPRITPAGAGKTI